MKTWRLDVQNYSDDELIEALMRVDDEMYPDNAMCLFRELLRRYQWSPAEASADALGVGERGWQTAVKAWLVAGGSGLELWDECNRDARNLDEKIQLLAVRCRAENSKK